MTSAQVVETSVNVISNSPSQDYTHPDDRTLLNNMVSYIQGSRYSVRVSHKVHDHLFTFFWLSLILRSIQCLCISLTAKSNKLVELRGIISKTVVCQSPSNLLIIIAKSVIPSLVPCGTPPWVMHHGDREIPTRTAWVRLVRKALIQTHRGWSTFKEDSSWRRMLWLIISDPFEKSTKNMRAQQFTVSTPWWNLPRLKLSSWLTM